MRGLLIEDDDRIGSFVVKGLQQAGFSMDRASDGASGLHMATCDSYDVAIIDIMLPQLDGISVIREMRDRGVATPVIVLSAKRAVDDRVTGLRAGGDDYLTKPFAFAELLARVQALLRRSSAGTATQTRLAYGDLSMDLLSREVVRDGQKITLHTREFSLLEYLLRNADRVLSKTMILDHVWGYSFDPQTNVVDVLVCRLRNTMDRDFPDKLIHTIRGVGYVLKKV